MQKGMGDFYILIGKRDRWYIPKEVEMNDKGFLRPIPTPDGLGPDRNYSMEDMGSNPTSPKLTSLCYVKKTGDAVLEEKDEG